MHSQKRAASATYKAPVLRCPSPPRAYPHGAAADDGRRQLARKRPPALPCPARLCGWLRYLLVLGKPPPCPALPASAATAYPAITSARVVEYLSYAARVSFSAACLVSPATRGPVRASGELGWVFGSEGHGR
jgi:hypothetical protein